MQLFTGHLKSFVNTINFQKIIQEHKDCLLDWQWYQINLNKLGYNNCSGQKKPETFNGGLYSTVDSNGKWLHELTFKESRPDLHSLAAWDYLEHYKSQCQFYGQSCHIWFVTIHNNKQK